MPKLLTKSGHLVMRAGALVTTEDSALCDCCGNGLPSNCNFCCPEGVRRFATVTVTGVTGAGCCADWNATWELEIVTTPDGGGGYICYWELLDGCGADPRIDLSIGTCIDGLQLLSIRFSGDRTTVPYASATFTHLGFDTLDCDTFWDTAWSFAYSGDNGSGCNFTAATVTMAFHD